MWNRIEKRRTPVCNGILSFHEAFKRSYGNHPVKKITDAQARLFLLFPEAVRVARDGTIQLEAGAGFGVGKNRYGADVLIEYGARKQKVVARFDPQKLHDPVSCYTLDGRFICDADCLIPAGFGDTDAAREHQRNRARKIKATKKAAKAQVRMDALEAAERLKTASIQDDDVEPPKVIRPVFKKAVGADFEDCPDDAADSRDAGDINVDFVRAVKKLRPKWREF